MQNKEINMLETDIDNLEIYEELDIESIEYINKPIELIDITVEDDNTFCITPLNIVSHNCNQLVKAATIPALETQCSMIIINHNYGDPGAMHAVKIKATRGGEGLKYMARLSLQCDKVPQKGDQEDGYYDGTLLKFFTTKSSHEVRPFLETEVPLSFSTGFKGKEFYGLIDSAIELGFIKNPKQGWYQVPSYSDKMIRRAELEGGKSAKAIWKTFIREYDEASQHKICYGKMSEDELEIAKEEDKNKAQELGVDLDKVLDDAEKISDES